MNAGCNMDYYKEHSQEFIDTTIECDMSEQYRFCEKYLKTKGTILDIGFGSGRDSLYFKANGYKVYAIDPEESFVKHAKENGLENVYQLKAEDISFKNMFDGIWACASLLHVSSANIPSVLTKCSEALKKDGIMYASFKYGDFEGERNGRFYLDLNENTIKRFLQESDLELVETLITEDVRIGNNTKWFNIILRNKNGN